MQTATNPQTGEKLVFQNGQWSPMGNATPAAPSAPMAGPITVGTPRPKPVDPLAVNRDRRDAVGDDLSNQGKVYDNQTKPVYDRANAIDKVRDGVRQDKRILTYESAIPIWASALKSPDNAEGDLMLVNAMAKINDPTTGVQQREGDSVAGASPQLDQVKATLLKQFGSDGYGNFTPEGRKRIRQTINIRMEKLTGAYRQAREEYRGYIKELGLPDVNAETVIGPHAGTPFQQDAADVMGRPVRNADGSLGPAPHAGNEAPATAPAGDDDVRAFVIANQGMEPAAMAEYAKFKLGRSIDNLPEVMAHLKATGQLSNRVVTNDPTTESLKAGVGDIVEGVGDVAGLVANPANAGVNWALGTNLTTDFGQSLRDATGLPEGDPTASAVTKGAVGAMTGAGIAGMAARGLGGTAASVAETIAAQPIQQGVAGASAGASTEAARRGGFGPGGQAVAGVVGGMAGYGGANALSQYAQRAASGGVNSLAQAAERQNVRLMPADQGGEELKNLTGAAAKAPLSAGPIIQGSKRTQADLGRALDRTANSEATPLPADEAGNALREPLKGYGAKQGERIGRVYKRAESRAEGVTIKPVGALQVIDDQLDRARQLGEMNEPLVKGLERLRRSIANGVRVGGMRDVRTALSQGVYDGKLRSNQEQAIYKTVVEAVSKDIENGLSQAGRKDALNLFKLADKEWKARIEYIDGVLEPLIGGNKSGEDILNAVEGMTRGQRGGAQRLGEVMRELPAEQAASVRSTIIERMGRATAANQDDTGAKFSASTFMTNWSKMSPKGKALMFGTGELRRNLDDIAKLASATEETGKFANFSNTAGGIWGNVGALGGVAALSPKFAIIAGVTQFLGGRAMASPALTRWLARMPENGAAQGRYADQLKQIAVREPIIANDIKSIQNFLNSGSYRAAAGSENEPEDRR